MLEKVEKMLRKYIYLALILFVLIILLLNSFASFNFNWISILMVFTIALMVMGQMLLITPYGIAYPFYVFSCFEAIVISLLPWLSNQLPFSIDFTLFTYAALVTILVAALFTVHWWTRRRSGNSSMIPAYSIFFFGLLIVLANSQTVSKASYDALFQVTIILFIVTSIFGLNIAYRNMILNKKLKIRDRNDYLRVIKDELKEKYTGPSVQDDIDLLVYYFCSSLDSFIDGDFDRSYMDAYKIAFDLNGKAFKNIFQLPENKERQKHFSEIRHHLSHAHITGGGKENKDVEIRDLQRLKEIKKNLFEETLDLLKIIRFEFIETALKKEEIAQVKA
jgi:hypothetical protein